MRTPLLACVAAVTFAAGCGPTSPADDSDPNFDTGKADGGDTATNKGTLDLSGVAQTVAFANADGTAAEYVYLSFELTGSASVTLQTAAAGSDTDLDTVLYLYEPTPTKWGAYIAKNDNGGDGDFSLITKSLGAGTYNAVIRLRDGSGTPSVAITGTCTGAGCAQPKRGCTDLTPRSQVPDLFVGPQDWKQSIEDAIDSTSTSLDIQMYLFTVTEIAQHVIEAQDRGVAVRVLLDPHENNAVVQAKLTAANVPNHTDPAKFTFAHAKYMILDRDTAVILSGNFNAGAVDTTDANGERNYGFIDHDADDVADLQAVYDTDWTDGDEPDLSCTRLIVSPINSKDRIIAHINTAMTTLDIEVLYLDDTYVQQAVLAAAARGATVRIMLSDPAKNPQNTAVQAMFNAKGIPTKILLTNYLHTKMIQADGVALVGSENMSETSLTMNREMGGLIFESAPAAIVHDQYEQDWASASAGSAQ